MVKIRLLLKKKFGLMGHYSSELRRRDKDFEEVGEGGDVRVYPSNMRGPRHIGNV